MRILYLNKTLSGPMESLARFVAQHHGVSSAFMAERWSKDTHLPGCSLVRLPSVFTRDVEPTQGAAFQHDAQNMVTRNLRNAANVKEACIRLRQSGFIPDIVYTTLQSGYGIDVHDVFPEARMVGRLGLLYQKQVPRPDDDTRIGLSTFERMYNMFQLTVLMECTSGIASSNWQKVQIHKAIRKKLRVISNGVDTQFFAPGEPGNPEGDEGEIITFSCQGTSPSRGIHTICAALPQLLALRPQCKVQIVSFAARRTDAGRLQHIGELAALLTALSDEQRKRVFIVPAPPLAVYRNLLQSTTLYVYLTTPGLLATGIMEAMSCGALVLASSTAPVRELVTHGVNGLLWEGHDPQSLAFYVAQASAQADDMRPLRLAARASILEHHDLGELLPRHAAALFEASAEPLE